jgi:hypothetical protein
LRRHFPATPFAVNLSRREAGDRNASVLSAGRIRRDRPAFPRGEALQQRRIRDSFRVSRNFQGLRGGKFPFGFAEGGIRRGRAVPRPGEARRRHPVRRHENLGRREAVIAVEFAHQRDPSIHRLEIALIARAMMIRDDLPHPRRRQRLGARDMRHRERIRQPLQNQKPPIRGLAARRDASGGFDGRRRRFLGTLALGPLGHD